MPNDKLTPEQIAEKLTAMEGQLAEAVSKTATLETKLADAEAVAKAAAKREQVLAGLSAEQFAKYAELDAEGKTAFLNAEDAGAREKILKARETPAPEDIPEPVRKRFEALETDRDAAKQEAKESRELVAKLLSERKLSTLEADAAEKYPNLPQTPQEIAKLLVAVDGLEEPISKGVREIFAAANEALKTVTKQRGSDVPGSAGDDDGWTEIEKAAKKIQAEEKLSFEKAVDAVLARNPDLYTQYLKAQGSGKPQ